MSATIDPDTKAAVNRNGKLPDDATCRLSAQTASKNFWREGAPKAIAGNDGRKVWLRYLSDRSNPVCLDELCHAKGTSLVWGINVSSLPSEAFELVQLVAQANRDKLPHQVAVAEALSQWLTNRNSNVQSTEFALGCVAVANLLPRVAGMIESELWWALVDALAEIVDESSDPRIGSDAEPQKALAHQILAGELPLTLAYHFPEIRPLYKLRAVAQDVLAEGLMELLNGAGLPHAGLMSVSRALLACWTRSRAMGGQWKQGCWTNQAEEQFQLAVGKSICLSSCTGQGLFCGDEVSTWTPDFLAAVLKFGGRAVDRTAACELFDKKLTKLVPGKSGKRIPESSEVCEWSGLALLRTEFGRDGAVVAIDFSHPAMKLDVWLGHQQLFYGSWDDEIWSGMERLEPVGSWEETCWFSDSDVDYVEFSIDLADGARLERQVLLAREDKFLLLVDNVMNVPGTSIQNRLSLPLAPGVGFVPEAETREGLLMGDRPLARVLPLALPEWRVDPRIGELSSADGQLQLVEERPGKNLSSPLFFDLDPKRLTKSCTWRQLTVAESLEIQPHDVAVGYRIQCGKKQWLVYRSQVPAANRTVLGYNLAIEGMIGRFQSPSGEVQELLQIEG
jgi:hypothetical protein